MLCTGVHLRMRGLGRLWIAKLQLLDVLLQPLFLLQCLPFRIIRTLTKLLDLLLQPQDSTLEICFVNDRGGGGNRFVLRWCGRWTTLCEPVALPTPCTPCESSPG
ncbi:hypothetical protein PAXRUDRAFT_364889 [Paxillus rubicundulus Ve08.2h10]|uniref:Uncharacterized protein n=1 Tax=Paxillus rubicundulus Ve08.2h10 TaxID=930991 RepID=A0A0D0DRK7_9AGAM|nr:hypothetical protein PAXRUDRAFT_364889 [Paxillus rubicundulus Ve08.2h10]